MHELAFADAARPSPVVILNLLLCEYSIGHELLLFRRRNALVISSPEEFSKLDFWEQVFYIREALWICSDPFSKRDAFERPARRNRIYEVGDLLVELRRHFTRFANHT